MEIDVFVSHHTESSLHIVEAIVNKLEAAGIRCWYAPRDTHGLYASEIYNMIQKCKVFLLILNGKASYSFDVGNEINIACDRVREGDPIDIIPFQIDNDEISPDAKYYLRRFHWIDAVTPPMYKRIEELVNYISRHLGNDGRESEEGDSRYQLSTAFPHVGTVFLGRELLIEKIKEFFDGQNHLLFLEGIGGIGKTEIAKQFAKDNMGKYNTVLFLTYTKPIFNLIIDDSVILINGLQGQRKNESDIDYYKRKMKILRTCCDRNTLVILDNFDVDQDVNLNDLDLLPCDILVTSRNAHPNYSSMKVDTIDEKEALMNILENYYEEPLSEDDKKYASQIIELVGGHTYAIELIARQMNASFMSPKEMLVTLKEGFSNLPEESFYSRGQAESSYRHLCALYDLSQLSEKDSNILDCLSLMGPRGVKANLFKEWIEADSYSGINRLISRGWIQRKEAKRISLHPLLIEIIHGQRQLDETNCEVFLRNVSNYLFHTWNRPYKENLEILDNIEYLSAYFTHPNMKEVKLFEYYGNYLWQVGRFEESIECQTRLYYTCVAQLGEDCVESATMAREVAGCYYNAGRREESFEWYIKALSHLLAAKIPENEELGIAYEKAARCYTWEKTRDLAKAEEYLLKSFEIRQNNIRRLKNGDTVEWANPNVKFDLYMAKSRLGECYLEMGEFYRIKEDYNKSLESFNKYKEILEELNPSNLASLSIVYYDIGRVQYLIGNNRAAKGENDDAFSDYTTAKRNMKIAVDYSTKWRGGLAVGTIDTYEGLGDVCVLLKQYAEASNAYMAALEISNHLLGTDSERSRVIKEKMEF